MKDGFYKLENEELMHAPNGVMAPDYSLERSNKDAYSLPIDGWYWFDAEEDARKFFGIKKPVEENTDQPEMHWGQA